MFSCIADTIGITIKDINVMPDHVHIFFKCTIKTNIPIIVQRMKGCTSYNLRRKYEFLKQYKAFWSPSYFIESIGNMSENVIRKYVQNQKINVKSAYKHVNLLR